MFDRCSVDTVRNRFFGLVRQFPWRYLDDVLAGRPEVHDALVARTPDGLIVALASLSTGDAVPELGVLVEDAWQHRGIGTSLVDLLVARARAAGAVRIAAGVLPDRTEILAGLDRRLPRHRVRRGTDVTTHVYDLV